MIGSTRYIAGVEIQRQSALSAEISKLQQSASSNKRLSAASDDPKAAARIADIRQVQADNAIWLRNVDTGAGIAKAADKSLASVSTALQRAKELMIAGANGSNLNVDRVQYAIELRSIAGQIAETAQAKDPNGQLLFPTSDPLAIPVAPGLSMAATASAEDVFGTVTTPHGTRSIVEILNAAADAINLGSDGKLPYTDADGNTTDADGKPLEMTRQAALDFGLSAIDAADDHIATMQTAQGLRAQQLDDIKDALKSDGDNLTLERSALEDTDLTYTVAAYQAKSLALTAAQTMFAQTHRNSLLDLLG